jgi:hypothetical protein
MKFRRPGDLTVGDEFGAPNTDYPDIDFTAVPEAVPEVVDPVLHGIRAIRDWCDYVEKARREVLDSSS